MAIYRVTGEHPETKASREIFVRASSLEAALEVAHSAAGLNKVSGVLANAKEAIGHPIITAEDGHLGAQPDRKDPLRFIARSHLISSPIMTIALGVFGGMLLWSIVGVILAMMLRTLWNFQ